MILDLARQGLSVSAIARRTGRDRKTIRACIERGLEPPAYKPREPAPSPLAPFEPFLRERVGRFPDLTGRRLWREVRDLGFTGGYSTVTDFLRTVRPPAEPAAFERRFETPPGRQAQVDFAFFKVRFEDEPGAERIVWLFSLVLGHSRMMWARFVAHEGMISVGGNLYSVPDGTRRRPVEVQVTAAEVHILENGRLIAAHPVLEGRGRRRIAEGHRRLPPTHNSTTPRAGAPVSPPAPAAATGVAPRSLAIYETIGRRLAAAETAR